jgi:rSAM/selenodomain-associated transferase 1
MSAVPALILFARNPVPGRAKTRLIPALGAEAAAELYRCFLLDSLEAAAGQRADVLVAVADADSLDAVRNLASPVCPRADFLVQQGDDLGQRMGHAFEAVFSRGYQGAVLVGTDVPSLPPLRVNDALRYCSSRDLVLGPSLDGGYYLIGLRKVIPECFADLPWGGPTVLVETLRRAHEAGASVSLLDPWYDVDTPEDLRVLRSHLTALDLARDTIFCPRTWEFLHRLPPET